MSPPLRPAEGAQLRALSATFLGRFFENEASGTSDLRQSFIWLITGLGTPGFFLPLYHTEIRWYEISMRYGLERLREFALFDKALYLNITMVSITLLAAIVWHSLLVDRRDGLILGGLPIRQRTVVLGKLGALAIYVGAITGGMHVLAAVLYGAFLGGMDHWTAIFRAAGAHFVASSALNVFLFAAIAALQSTCLALAGPRWFARASTPLQMLVVAFAMVALMLIPLTSAGAAPAFVGGSDTLPWLTMVPSIWFLGLYETLAGTDIAAMHDLTATAMTALASSILLLVVTYPIAVRRVLGDAVQGTGTARAPFLRRLGAHVTTRLSVEAPVRAMTQFALATFGRVHQHRLVLSIGLGGGVVMAVTAGLASLSPVTGLPRSRPVISLAAVPLYFMYASALAWRVAVAVPSDLPARWLFAVAPAPMFAGRRSVRRLAVLVCIALPLVVIAPVWMFFWGPRLALVFAAQDIVLGLIVLDLVFWGFADAPCTRTIATGRANVPSRVPVMVVGLWVLGYAWPVLQVALNHSAVWPAVMLGLLTLVWWGVRTGSDYTAMVNATTGDDDGLLLLDLSPPPVAPVRLPTTPAPGA
jgi:hypothetical protein